MPATGSDSRKVDQVTQYQQPYAPAGDSGVVDQVANEGYECYIVLEEIEAPSQRVGLSSTTYVEIAGNDDRFASHARPLAISSEWLTPFDEMLIWGSLMEITVK